MKRCSFFDFLLGIIVGVIIGVLIAPESGDKTRKVLMKKTDDVNKNLKKKMNDAKYDISGVTDTIKDTITLYTGASIEPLEKDNYFEKEFEV